MLPKVVGKTTQMFPAQARERGAGDALLGVRHHRGRLVDHLPTRLLHAQTQINIFRTVKNPFVQQADLIQRPPADELAGANHIVHRP